MFHAFGGCECPDNGRDKACHVAEGTLYLSYQLNECQHGAVGDGTGIQTVDAPDERKQIAGGETEVDGKVTETGE